MSNHPVAMRSLADVWIDKSALLLGFLLPAALALFAMWSTSSYTVDDAYISFRYAQNLAEGEGLVYNVGEYVEGYTNFLWTVLLAAGIKLGLLVEPLSKVLGAVFAILTLLFVYRLAQRLSPNNRWPVLATWLVAGNMVFSGYALQGLETAMFACLVLAGSLRFLVEEQEGRPVIGSAVLFALAGLTRPEAPLFLGMLMLLGATSQRPLSSLFTARNITRGVVFAVPLVVHMLWRYDYYGSWLPNTLLAKTGDSAQQHQAGFAYLRNYFHHQGLVAYLVILAVIAAVVQLHRALMALAGVIFAAAIYVVLVGGDWMPLFRFMVPIIPFIALLVDAFLRQGLRADHTVVKCCAMAVVLMVAIQMAMQARTDHQLLAETELEWNRHAGGTAWWFAKREEQYGRARVEGSIALGDIGEVGFVSGYYILDLLGLVDPVIARLPGGYTQKTGKGFRDYFFVRQPRYVVIISSGQLCESPSVTGSRALYNDVRFKATYAVTGQVWAGGGFFWCIFEDRTMQLSAAIAGG